MRLKQCNSCKKYVVRTVAPCSYCGGTDFYYLSQEEATTLSVHQSEFGVPGQKIVKVETIFLGGAGVPMKAKEQASLIVGSQGFSIQQSGKSNWSISFEGLRGIQITGAGRYQTGGGWTGGGFGFSGAIQGAAIASVMNMLTTRHHNDCLFRFVYPGIDATFQVLSHTPGSLQIELSGLRNWIETRGESSDNQTITTQSRVDQLEKLYLLFEKGALDKSEFDAEKKRILSS